MEIANRRIDLTEAPYLIAEMSGNHNGSLERALDLVDAAAAAGADAIKLQTFTADTITLDVRRDEFTINDPKSLWHGRSLYDLYTEAATPWEWHEPIIQRAVDKGLVCFSSPFDESSVDFLEELDVPAYKIASPEIVDLGLINYVAQTGKPIIMSTGMATLAEIDEAVEVVRSTGNANIALLQCTSSYPASPKDSNVATVPNMRAVFGCEVGLSDHTMGCGAAVAAIALGATIIEKHFTLSREDGGIDSAFSLEPEEFAQLATESRRAKDALGGVKYGPSSDEARGLVFRRSLYVVQDIRAGEKFTKQNVRSIRPSAGLHPRWLNTLIGRTAKTDLKSGSPVSIDMLF